MSSLICHIILDTVHLSNCHCHIAFCTFYLSPHISHIAFVLGRRKGNPPLIIRRNARTLPLFCIFQNEYCISQIATLNCILKIVSNKYHLINCTMQIAYYKLHIVNCFYQLALYLTYCKFLQKL